MSVCGETLLVCLCVHDVSVNSTVVVVVVVIVECIACQISSASCQHLHGQNAIVGIRRQVCQATTVHNLTHRLDFLARTLIHVR